MLAFQMTTNKMNALIKRIAEKVTVDFTPLSIVSNPDGLLMQAPVRSLLYQQHGIKVVTGTNLQLRIHYELEYKKHRDCNYLYVSESIGTVLPDMRREAYVCDFSVADVFPLFFLPIS